MLREITNRIFDNVIDHAVVWLLGLAGLVLACAWRKLKRPVFAACGWVAQALHLRHVETPEEREARQDRERGESEDPNIWKPL